MAKDCGACKDLRTNAPDFLQYGLTDTACTSLKNNTGFSPSTKTNNCDDLTDAAECLVGDMEHEVKSYDVCDWKEFMKKFAHNTALVLKALACAVCGVWAQIDKIWCWLEHMNKNTGGSLHAYVDDDPTKSPINGFRIASGVSVRNPKTSKAAAMNISVIGSTARVTGSLYFNGKIPADYGKTSGGDTVDWLDFYNGSAELTNKEGQKTKNGNTPKGGWLIYEYEVNPCDYGFTTLYTANLGAADAGNFTFRIDCIHEGNEYPFDYGWKIKDDNTTEGQIYKPSKDGYVLIQVRMEYMGTWGITGSTGNVTPNGITMANPCKKNWDC